jgi:glycosyltransferase involved in cell wall biosynthesis
MKFSIVTVSFNQAQFLEATIKSVIEQDYPDIEYIVVDPGSTDGSREIIERYRDRITTVVLEPDRGAADGLNKGFARATGQLFGFLNSDDILLPGALSAAAKFLIANPRIDMVSGKCEVIDAEGRFLRHAWSDRFSLWRFAHGGCTLIQPSSFFRATAYRATGGFNPDNGSNWDGELFVAMARQGARFARVHETWSGYRVHGQSITGSARLHSAIERYRVRMFREILGRPSGPTDRAVGVLCRALKYIETPQSLIERLLRGPVYGRTAGA